jgi:phosphonoacetaldehyde dehydrogenase
MYEFGSIIDGRQEQSDSWIDVRNPYTGGLTGRVSSVGVECALRVLANARSRKIRLSRHERSEILNRMAARLESEKAPVSQLITGEAGLCLKDTLYEVGRASDVLRFSAMRALEDDSAVFPCDVSQNGRARRIYTMRQPLNLIAAITPFNHPLNQVVHKIAPAIATNNTVVLKPSQQTPLSAYYLVNLAFQCGMPAGMIDVISGPTTEVAETIVSSSLVEMLTFTGGSSVGQRIAAIAGYKRLVLELGGSSAMLVLRDADVAEAVGIAISGIYKNSGQRCTAIRRLLVHNSLVVEFGQLLAESVNQLRYGDPFDPRTDVGTVISEKAARDIEQQVQASVQQGAQVLVGHHREGAVYAPTVLTGVRNDHPVAARELFGPVACIIGFDSLDEAIHIANDTEFGLSGAVVSNHWPSIQRVITELETGTVNVNEAPSYRLEWSPFGGIKLSGLGYKEGVIESMKSMTNIKTYSLAWDQP